MQVKRQHVIPDRKGVWSVRKDGAARASGRFETQSEALDFARSIAMKTGARSSFTGQMALSQVAIFTRCRDPVNNWAARANRTKRRGLCRRSFGAFGFKRET
eukprot:TRINITY_DN86406_c0_g1_i1.p1 TRINITY_DN86406_c0_g1~~TRINITY_DN86406_c0_g1_i1.p1  ORF type:complete len:102 (+),score=0.72 TRINITY_DN86406_c0_g1_i1:115-420(+)